MAVVEQKEEIIREHRTHEGDTGSPEVQVAVLTRRIAHLTEQIRRDVKEARIIAGGPG